MAPCEFDSDQHTQLAAPARSQANQWAWETLTEIDKKLKYVVNLGVAYIFKYLNIDLQK